MTNENDLIQKLMISKKIMEKHNTIPRRSDALPDINTPMVESYEAPQAKYNLPQELVQELVQESTYQPKSQQPVTQDKILSSKLPDEIKKLMIEHPISQPNSTSGPTLSNELVDKAARLMSLGSDGNGYKGKGSIRETESHKENLLNNTNLRSLLKEVVEEVLSENGMLIESTSKTNDTFSFKVGKHIFEGKVTKVKKIK